MSGCFPTRQVLAGRSLISSATQGKRHLKRKRHWRWHRSSWQTWVTLAIFGAKKSRPSSFANTDSVWSIVCVSDFLASYSFLSFVWCVSDIDSLQWKGTIHIWLFVSFRCFPGVEPTKEELDMDQWYPSHLWDENSNLLPGDLAEEIAWRFHDPWISERPCEKWRLQTCWPSMSWKPNVAYNHRLYIYIYLSLSLSVVHWTAALIHFGWFLASARDPFLTAWNYNSDNFEARPRETNWSHHVTSCKKCYHLKTVAPPRSKFHQGRCN